MKLFRGILSASLFFSLVAAMTVTVQGQGLTINLIMSPNPSPRVGDWSTHRETAQLIVTNTSGASKQVKLSTQISLNGSLVAFTKNQSMPVLTIPPGAMTYDAGSLVPYSDVTFQGQIDQNVKRTGLLPEGMYQICVSLIDPSSFAQITQPVCQSFTILGYQQPILLSPADTSVVNASSSAPPPIFMWTPITPAATGPVTYHFRLIELMPGQQPRAAFLTNPPLFEIDIMNTTQFVYTPNASPLRDGMVYVWSIQARDQFGTVLGQGDGWAVPFSFRAVLTSGQPQIVDNKKGLMFIPDGMGVLIGSPEYLKDVTVRGWDPSNKQGMNEKITLHHEGLYSMSIGDIAFEDGDPDRPIIIGMQYNGADGQKHLVNIGMPAGMVFNVHGQPSDDFMQGSLGQKQWQDVLTNPAAQPFEDAVVRGMDKSHRLMRGNGGADGSVAKGDGDIPGTGAAKGQAQEGAYNPKEYGTKNIYLELHGQPAAMLSAGDVNGDGFPDVAYGDVNGDGRNDVALGDVNGDGRPDNVVPVDMNRDGTMDIVFRDLNGDGMSYYFKHKGKMNNLQTNPMYEDNKMGGTNPLYEGKDMMASPVIVSNGDDGIVGGFQSSAFELKTNDATGHYLRKKLPGKMKSGQITLTRGVTRTTGLFTWISDIQQGQNVRKNITLTILDRDSKSARTYNLHDCFPIEASCSVEAHGKSWVDHWDSRTAANSSQGGNGGATDKNDSTQWIDVNAFQWGSFTLSFDSADVDSVPVRSITDLSQYLGNISGPLGNVTGNIDLQKGRMTLLEPVTIPGSGDALLLITGKVSTIDPFPDPPNSSLAPGGGDPYPDPPNAIKGNVSISSGGDNPTESRIKVQFHWDRQGKNDDKDNSIVEFVPDGSSDSGGTKSSSNYAVQYRETSFDAFYNVPSSLLPNASTVFTPIATGGGNGGGATSGRLYPTSPSPITFTCEMGMSKNMYDWIKSSMSDRHLHQSGIIHRDLAARNIMATPGDGMSGNHKDCMDCGGLAFMNAQITEIGFPALDAASKDAAKMTIKIKPEKTQDTDLSNVGFPALDAGAKDAMTQKKWLPANFRISIDGLGDACKRVNKIDAFTWKQGMAPGDGGGAGKNNADYDPQKQDGEIGGIVISLPETEGKGFDAWNESSLTTRKAGGTQNESSLTTRKAGEKPINGILEYLSGDGSVLYTFDLEDISVSKVTKQGGTEQIHLAVERMELK